MKTQALACLSGAALFLVVAIEAAAQRQMERLDRGVVAVRQDDGRVFVGWRLLGTDPEETAFNVYRGSGGGEPVKLNDAPLAGPTHFIDHDADPSQDHTWFVRAVLAGDEQPTDGEFTFRANSPARSYLSIPLQIPPGGTTPDGRRYSYTANDASVGDLDGDGQYEIILKWQPTNARDNSHSGYTGHVILDAYKLDGTRLWRIDLGPNIRAGAHYTPFMVYDLDGSGRAEIACKTADGTVDGAGNVLGDPEADYRNARGYVLEGPEFLTVFDGLTGAALATVPFLPDRGDVRQWGDDYGNRVDRFLAAVAYLDGERPSLVFARGYYGPQRPGGQARNELTAWDFRDGGLSLRWWFRAGLNIHGNVNRDYVGQGNHQLAVADVDGDGRDEIIYGACVINHDGTGLHTTGWGHGDALHVAPMDPGRPGFQIFMPHEYPRQYGPNAVSFRDARTGELIWGVSSTGDIGRGAAMDIDPRHPGYEMWASGDTGGLYTAQRAAPNAEAGPRGVQISSRKPNSINFGVWWDGDLLRELLDRTTISKWNWETERTEVLFSPPGVASNNGSKATPCLSADILGDWREEVVWRSRDNRELRIYTTTIPTEHRISTLMHDPVYRLSVAWQNVGYNQPPHPGFFLGHGMQPPPRPSIVTVPAARDE